VNGTLSSIDEALAAQRPAKLSERDRTEAGSAPAGAGSLLQVGRNCCAVARAERAAFLVDAAAYFEAFARAAERAERSIIILAWDFDSRTALSFDETGTPRRTLGEFLNGLARRRRRLHVRALDWDYPMIFGHDREFPPVYGLSWKPHRRVDFHYDDTHPLGGSHHQKIVVIDDKMAFVGGLDLTTRRWDTPEHRPDDPRRVAFGNPYPPFHDLMIAVDGEAAGHLAEIARKRWRTATGETLAPVQVAGDPWPPSFASDITNVEVGIACTAPAVNGEQGARDVAQLYLDLIARAKRYIFLENQYFTSQKIGEALAARLVEPDGPEIVLVMRLLSHGWLEEMTMHVLRTRLIRQLRAADRHGRFQIYYPHIGGLAPGTCVDVHSKAMVVDDEWLRIGSSNLSNRSMGLDTECDVVVEARGAPRVARAIRRFRDRLLAEHLGVREDDVASKIEQAGSMNAAIGALGSERRTLRPLEEVPEWSDAVVSAVSFADPERPVSLERLVEQFSPDTEVRRTASRWKPVLAIVAAVAGLAAAWRFTPLATLVTADNVIAWAETFAGQWWAPLVIVLAYTPASVVMFPRPLITLAAVVAFGPWLGFGYAMGGILVAAVLTYAAGRLVSRDTVRRLSGRRLNRLTNALRKRGLLAMTALRLVPLAPFAVESLVAGAIHIRLWHFALGTFLGMLPGTLAATVFGDQLEIALRDPSQINYGLVAGILGALAIATYGVRRWFAKMEKGAASPQSDALSRPRR
jgi:phospholipase D1/2